MSMVMAGSMSQLWGMINGIQFIIHLPVLNINMPANAVLISKSLITIATFELPWISMETTGIYKIEDGEVLTDAPANVVSSMD
jgi:hypothetical protein